VYVDFVDKFARDCISCVWRAILYQLGGATDRWIMILAHPQRMEDMGKKELAHRAIPQVEGSTVATDISSRQGAGESKLTSAPKYHDVFFDPTGRRWRLAQSVALIIITLALVIVAGSCGSVFQPPPLGEHGRPLAEPDLGDLGQSGPIQIIGVGPLVRVVRLDHTLERLWRLIPSPTAHLAR
jgi:hypothetical protein